MQGIKTNQVIINLGLENNFYTSKENIAELINTTCLNTFTTSIKIDNGEYIGNPEPTAVIYCNTTETNLDTIIKDMQKLCIVFTQEFIPFEFKSTKETFTKLVNNPNMKDLPQITFSYDYFLK